MTIFTSQTKNLAIAMLVAAATATTASAMCGINSTRGLGANALALRNFKPASMPRAAANPAPADTATAPPPSIVGLWNVQFVAGGQVIDMGFDAWLSDGTEILNDTSPPPTGNVCLGTWVATGPLSYRLTHPSWIFDSANVNVIAIATIREQITLDPSGNTFSGQATFDEVDLSGNDLGQSASQITGTRITAATATNTGTAAVVTPTALTTSDASAVLDASGSTSASGALTYFFSVLPGGKVPAILQASNNPKATIQFVSGPGVYMLQLTVTDALGNMAMSAPIVLTYTGN